MVDEIKKFPKILISFTLSKKKNKFNLYEMPHHRDVYLKFFTNGELKKNCSKGIRRARKFKFKIQKETNKRRMLGEKKGPQRERKKGEDVKRVVEGIMVRKQGERGGGEKD